MSGWQLLSDAGQRAEAAGADTSISNGTDVSAHPATPNAKGSWVQLIAATAFDANALWTAACSDGLTQAAFLIDIGIGGAGSEQVIIPNISVRMNGTQHEHRLLFPISIPAGSRVAVRCQASTASLSFPIVVHLLAGAGFLGSVPFNRVEAWGPNTGTSAGTELDAGAVAHTKGSYAQLTAATTIDAKAVALTYTTKDVSQAADAWFLMDLAIGGAGSEVVLISNFPIQVDSAREPNKVQTFGAFPCHIPSGSRVAARMQSSTTNAADRIIELAAYGIS